MIILTKKHIPLSEAHKDAISRGLQRYHSLNDMPQETRDAISKSQKIRLAKRSLEQIEAHKIAVSKTMRKYYEEHDGPWKGIKRDDEYKNQVSETLKELYKNGHTNGCNDKPLSQSHKDKISKSLIETWKTKEKKPRSQEAKDKISKSLKEWYKKRDK